MQEATYDLTVQAMDGVGSKDDERLRVQFLMLPEQNQEKSAKEGRPIYDEKEYVQIMVPGERDIVVRRAWDLDKARFPRQYAAFKNKQSQDSVSGTPLKVVPWLTMGQVKELEYFNCFTVEQLANMPDSTVAKFMAFQALKKRANDYLVAAKEAAPLTAIRAELDERDSKIAVLEKQLAEVLAKMDKISKEK